MCPWPLALGHSLAPGAGTIRSLRWRLSGLSDLQAGRNFQVSSNRSTWPTTKKLGHKLVASYNVCVILIVMLLSFLVTTFCWLFSVVMFVVILVVVVCVFVISLVIFFCNLFVF